MLLRVSPDGSYAKIVLNTYDSDMVGWLAEAAYRQAASPSPLSVITNGDQGVAVFSPATDATGPQITYVSGDAVTAEVSLALSPYIPPGTGNALAAFWPELQREDGSFIGTAGVVFSGGECYAPGNPTPCPSASYVQEPLNENSPALAAVGSSGIVWQQQFGSSDDPVPILPLYATSDGGMIVTSSQKATPEEQVALFSLGTLYTLDQNGNTTSQTADSGAVPSWTNNWYGSGPGNFTDIAFPEVPFTPTFGAIIGGSHTGIGLAVQQVQTNQTQGSDEQLPPTGATLNTNYNSIELLTTLTPAQIFTQYIQTFAGAQLGNNTIATVPTTTNVTASGQTLTFTLHGLMSLGQGPFKVETERFDTSAHVISVVTLKGHPLEGWRYWRVYSVGANDVVVETGAADLPGPGRTNYWGFYFFKSQQIEMWQQYLEYIKNKLGAPQGTTFQYNLVGGKWGYYPQNYILTNVCQASWCQ